MAAVQEVVRNSPCPRYALALAPAVHHKLCHPVVTLVHSHNPAVPEEVEAVCCSRSAGNPEKDYCLMSSSQCRKMDGHPDDVDGVMHCS